MSQPSEAVDAALKRLPAILRNALKASCGGDWGRVTVDAKGAFTVHNQARSVKTALRVPAAKAPAKKAAPKAPKRTPSFDPPAEGLALPGERRKEFTTRITSAARDALTAAERPPVKGVVIESLTPDEREDKRRLNAPERVVVPPAASAPAPSSDELLSRLGNGVASKWAQGLPPEVGYEYLPDVLALYGLDQDLTESCLRNPERVQLRPESFNKDKRYVVLGFWKGDVNIILGLRDPKNPCIIAAYVSSQLEHDIHRVGHAGGGGAKKESGVPKTPRAVAKALRMMGAEVTLDPTQDTALVLYKGQELGSIRSKPTTTRDEAESDYQRMQRKIHAINRRESVAS